MRRRLSGSSRLGSIVAVTAAVLAVTAGAAVPALASEMPGPGPFMVAPALTASGQARPYFQLSAASGGSARDVVAFSNIGSSTERLRVGVANGLTATNSGSAFGALGRDCAGIACWVIGLPPTITLAPHTQEEVEFQVNVPHGTPPAQYLAGITATPETATQPTPQGSSAHGSTTVTIVPRVVISVAVTVGSLSALRVDTNVTGITAGWVDGIPRLTVRVHNAGQRFTKGTGKLSCTAGGSTRQYPLDMDTVLPGQSAGLAINGRGMSQGTWQCSARLKETGGSTARWTGKLGVPDSQPAKTQRVSSGAGSAAYVAPSGGIPGWAIGLMVLGGLLLVTLWVLFLRRGRNRPVAPS